MTRFHHWPVKVRSTLTNGHGNVVLTQLEATDLIQLLIIVRHFKWPLVINALHLPHFVHLNPPK